jgi:hypothetical protein
MKTNSISPFLKLEGDLKKETSLQLSFFKGMASMTRDIKYALEWGLSLEKDTTWFFDLPGKTRPEDNGQ